MGKTNYILADFAATVQSRFPERAQELRMAVDKRMKQLRQLYGGATKEMRFHLENQIIPGIAVYETLCRVMPREEAVAVFHGYVENRDRYVEGSVADRYDALSVPRCLCAMRLPGALPLLLRQRRHHLRSSAQTAILAPHKNIGTGR